jgi:hypothetical protein
MKGYELRLLRQDGSLMCLIRSGAWSEYQARRVVKGMQQVPFARLEVWRDDSLILASGSAVAASPPPSWDRRDSSAASG